jgi:flagellar motor switch protein FliM
MTYDEYVRSSPNPSFLTLFTMEPMSGAGLLQMPLPIAMPAIDRLLGGPGDGKQPERALSAIETGLLKDLVQRALHEFDYAFESLGKIESKALHAESNPQFAQIIAPSEMVVVARFDVRIGAAPASEASLCIPLASLQPVLDTVTGQSFFTDRKTYDPAQVARAMADRIAEAPVDVSVQFNEVVLTSDDILSLQPGDVLPLRHPVSAPLSVSASGSVCAHAVPGSKGSRLAFMVVPSPDKDSL